MQNILLDRSFFSSRGPLTEPTFIKLELLQLFACLKSNAQAYNEYKETVGDRKLPNWDWDSGAYNTSSRSIYNKCALLQIQLMFYILLNHSESLKPFIDSDLMDQLLSRIKKQFRQTYNLFKTDKYALMTTPVFFKARPLLAVSLATINDINNNSTPKILSLMRSQTQVSNVADTLDKDRLWHSPFSANLMDGYATSSSGFCVVDKLDGYIALRRCLLREATHYVTHISFDQNLLRNGIIMPDASGRSRRYTTITGMSFYSLLRYLEACADKYSLIIENISKFDTRKIPSHKLLFENSMLAWGLGSNTYELDNSLNVLKTPLENAPTLVGEVINSINSMIPSAVKEKLDEVITSTIRSKMKFQYSNDTSGYWTPSSTSTTSTRY